LKIAEKHWCIKATYRSSHLRLLAFSIAAGIEPLMRLLSLSSSLPSKIMTITKR
jgi:hypothetical protein